MLLGPMCFFRNKCFDSSITEGISPWLIYGVYIKIKLTQGYGEKKKDVANAEVVREWFVSRLKSGDFPRGRNLDMACNELEQFADKSRALETRNALINVRNM